MAITRFIGDRFVGLSSDTKPLNVEDYATYKEYNGVFNEYILVSGSWISSNPTGEISYSGYSGYSGYGSGVSGYSGISGRSGYTGPQGYSGQIGDGNIFYLDRSIPSDVSNATPLKRRVGGNSLYIGQADGSIATGDGIVGGIDFSGKRGTYTHFITDSGVPNLSVLPPGSWKFAIVARVYSGSSALFTPSVGVTEHTSLQVNFYSGITGLFTGNSFLITGDNLGLRQYVTFFEQTGEFVLKPTNRIVYSLLKQNLFPTGDVITYPDVEYYTGTFIEGPIFKGQRGGIGYPWSGALVSTFLNTMSGISHYENVPSLRAETYRKAALYVTKGSGTAYDGYGGMFFFENITGIDDGVNIIKPNNISTGSLGRYKLFL